MVLSCFDARLAFQAPSHCSDDAPGKSFVIREMHAKDAIALVGVLQETKGPFQSKIHTERNELYSMSGKHTLVAMKGEDIVGFAIAMPVVKDTLCITDIEALGKNDAREAILRSLIRGTALRALSHGQKSLDITPRDGSDPLLDRMCDSYEASSWLYDDDIGYTIENLPKHFGYNGPKNKQGFEF